MDHKNNNDMVDLQCRATEWHEQRFPEATDWQVVMKAGEEVGELLGAVNAVYGENSAHPERASHVLEEAADVVVTILVLCGRYIGQNLHEAVSAKLEILEAGIHPASLK